MVPAQSFVCGGATHAHTAGPEEMQDTTNTTAKNRFRVANAVPHKTRIVRLCRNAC